MSRGDLVTVAMSGDFGKPRPALVVQADHFGETATVTVLLLSGTLVDAPLIRLTLEPTAENGLRMPSQIMVDKAMSVKRDKIGQPIEPDRPRDHDCGQPFPGSLSRLCLIPIRPRQVRPSVSTNRTARPVDGATSSPSHMTRRPRTTVPTGQPVTVLPS